MNKFAALIISYGHKVVHHQYSAIFILLRDVEYTCIKTTSILQLEMEDWMHKVVCKNMIACNQQVSYGNANSTKDQE